MTTDRSEQSGDAQAQQHPEGNVPARIESPEVGLPVENGQPSGEQNAEEPSTTEPTSTETDATEPNEREED